MKGLKSAIQRISSKIPPQCSTNPSDPRFCPGGRGRRKNFDFGGSEPPPPPECFCSLMEYPPPFSDGEFFDDCSGSINLNFEIRWELPTADFTNCQNFRLCFYPEISPEDFQLDPSIEVLIIINGISIPMIPNEKNCFDFSPGDSISFGFLSQSFSGFQTSTQITITNESPGCPLESWNPFSMYLFRNQNFSIFPTWNIQSVFSEMNSAQLGCFQYTGGIQQILIDAYANTQTFNPNSEIIIYAGSDPDPLNNPGYPIVLGGNSQGLFEIYLNPGDYFCIIGNTADDFCSLYEIVIDNRYANRCSFNQSWVIEFMMNSLAC